MGRHLGKFGAVRQMHSQALQNNTEDPVWQKSEGFFLIQVQEGKKSRSKTDKSFQAA